MGLNSVYSVGSLFKLLVRLTTHVSSGKSVWNLELRVLFFFFFFSRKAVIHVSSESSLHCCFTSFIYCSIFYSVITEPIAFGF